MTGGRRSWDSGFERRGQACDIVVYGDSTSSVGIDSSLITAQTGLSSCNISTIRPIVDDLGTRPLDEFLKHNAKPRVIVLSFGPEVFYRSKSGWEHNASFAPMMMLARDFPRFEALRVMLMHPSQCLQFMQIILRNRIRPVEAAIANDRRNYKKMIAYFMETQGTAGLELLRIRRLETCDYPPLKLYGPVDSTWIRSVHQRYESQQIAVIVMATPIPDCDPQLALFQRDLNHAIDSPLQSSAATNFLYDGRHASIDGSKDLTLKLVDILEAHGFVRAGSRAAQLSTNESPLGATPQGGTR